MSDFTPFEDLLPEDAMPLHGIRIIEFMDAEGESSLRFKVTGDVQLATTIGVLEIAKSSYVSDAWDE